MTHMTTLIPCIDVFRTILAHNTTPKHKTCCCEEAPHHHFTGHLKPQPCSINHKPYCFCSPSQTAARQTKNCNYWSSLVWSEKSLASSELEPMRKARKTDKGGKYLVSWKVFGTKENLWEQRINLENYLELTFEFDAGLPDTALQHRTTRACSCIYNVVEIDDQ